MNIALRTAWLTVASTGLGGLPACALPPPAASARSSVTISIFKPTLHRGMTEDRVRAAWGAPKQAEASGRLRADGETGTVLTYQFEVGVDQRPVAVKLVEVPYFDPITGAYRPIKEPAYELQRTVYYRNVELLLVEGVLVDWQSHVVAHRNFE